MVILFIILKSKINFFVIINFSKKGEIEETDNSSLIQNLKINIDDKSGLIDFKNEFPNEFFIEFNKFDRNFSIKYVKVHRFNNAHPIKSDDIYVIDQITGQPVKYDLNDEEVCSF